MTHGSHQHPIRHGWTLADWEEYEERIAIMICDGTPEAEAETVAAQLIEQRKKASLSTHPERSPGLV